MGNKPKAKKVSILCEGQIEFNYFSGYKKQKNRYERVSIEVKKLPNASYKSAKHYLEKSCYVGIPLVVLDLDRVEDKREHPALDALIAEVKKKKGFLFLTYRCFEDWIGAHFERGDLETIFGVRSRSDLKQFCAQCSDLYQEIRRRNGSVDRAKSYYSPKAIYLNLDFQKSHEHLMSNQSSLFLLDDVLKNITN